MSPLVRDLTFLMMPFGADSMRQATASQGSSGKSGRRSRSRGRASGGGHAPNVVMTKVVKLERKLRAARRPDDPDVREALEGR